MPIAAGMAEGVVHSMADFSNIIVRTMSRWQQELLGKFILEEFQQAARLLVDDQNLYSNHICNTFMKCNMCF